MDGLSCGLFCGVFWLWVSACCVGYYSCVGFVDVFVVVGFVYL